MRNPIGGDPDRTGKTPEAAAMHDADSVARGLGKAASKRCTP